MVPAEFFYCVQHQRLAFSIRFPLPASRFRFLLVFYFLVSSFGGLRRPTKESPKNDERPKPPNPRRPVGKSEGGGVGGGGGPSCRFLSIHSQTDCGSHPFLSSILRPTMRTVSLGPRSGFTAYK